MEWLTHAAASTRVADQPVPVKHPWSRDLTRRIQVAGARTVAWPRPPTPRIREPSPASSPRVPALPSLDPRSSQRRGSSARGVARKPAATSTHDLPTMSQRAARTASRSPSSRPRGVELAVVQPVPGPRLWGASREICFDGGPHDFIDSPLYGVPKDFPREGAEAGWRRCARCQELTFNGSGVPDGLCLDGAPHDFTGSPAYSIAVEEKTGPPPRPGHASRSRRTRCRSSSTAPASPRGGASSCRLSRAPPASRLTSSLTVSDGFSTSWTRSFPVTQAAR
jgi:hypothetical protein